MHFLDRKKRFNSDAHRKGLQNDSSITPWICGQPGLPSFPQAPPGSFTIMNSDSQIPYGTKSGRYLPILIQSVMCIFISGLKIFTKLTRVENFCSINRQYFFPQQFQLIRIKRIT